MTGQELKIRSGVLMELAPRAAYLPVAVSGRHAHLCAADVEALFGAGYQLRELRPLSQPGQFACQETVSFTGPKGTIEHIRVLGPPRGETQVELTVTDCYRTGVEPVVRMSGEAAGTPGGQLTGSAGSVRIGRGVMVARRHVHLRPEQAAAYGLSDGDTVNLRQGGQRPAVLEGFAVRVSQAFELEAHIDTDEANACCIQNGDLLELANGPQTGGMEQTLEQDGIKETNGAVVVPMGPAAEGCARVVRDLAGPNAAVLLPAGAAECLPGFAHVRFEGAGQLQTLLFSAEHIVLAGAAPGDVVALAQRGGGCDAARAAIHALLRGVRLTLILDFELPRNPRGTFFEQLANAAEALRAMGVEARFCATKNKQADAGRDLITEDDVKAAHRRGETNIVCAPGAIVTPLARDTARELGISLGQDQL